MELPFRQRISHLNAKYPSNLTLPEPYDSTPALKITDRCNRIINKSFATLQQQLQLNRQYLANFQTKVEKVYQMENLRGTLKERQYNNLLHSIEAKKLAATEEVRIIKQQNMKDYREVMEQNCYLHGLKGSYEQILAKLEDQLSRENRLVKELKQRNNETKQKIKLAWKLIGAEAHEKQNKDQQSPPIMRKLKRQITLLCKSKENTVKSKPPPTIEEMESLYVTEHQICQPKSSREEKKVGISTICSLKESQQNTELTASSSKVNSSLAGYEDAIKKIEQLEMSIIASKKCKPINKNAGSSISEQKMRKQRIRERVEEVEYGMEMLKLFIVYLKSNDSTENRTELVNLRKVICYFEKVLKHKQDVLKNIKEMSKNI